MCEEERSRDEVLDGGDDGLAVARRDDIGFDVHQLQSLSTSLFCLWDIYPHTSVVIAQDEGRERRTEVHLVAIEVGVVRVANTLVEPE